MAPKTLDLSMDLRQYVGDELFETRACRGVDTNTFYPERGDLSKKAFAEIVRYAISFCDDCPIKDDCLFYARSNNLTDGIWGGVYLNEYHKRPRKNY